MLLTLSSVGTARAAVLTVGPGQQYASPASALTQAVDGDEIFVYADEYTISRPVSSRASVKIVAVGDVVFEFTGDGVIVQEDSTLTVEGVTFRPMVSRAAIVEGDGALALFDVTIEGGGDGAADRDVPTIEVSEGAVVTLTRVRQSGAKGALVRVTDSGEVRAEAVVVEGTEAAHHAVFIVDGGELALHSVIVRATRASEDGGAIRAVDGVVDVVDSRFESNWARHGGAISSIDSTMRVSESVFLENRATAPSSWGGAIHVGGEAGEFEVEDSVFEFNESTRYGGAVATDTSAPVRLVRSMFCNNDAGAGIGGGVYVDSPSSSKPQVLVRHALFSRNAADQSGGGFGCAAAVGFGAAEPEIDIEYSAFIYNRLLYKDAIEDAAVELYAGVCTGTYRGVYIDSKQYEGTGFDAPRDRIAIQGALMGDHVSYTVRTGYPGGALRSRVPFYEHYYGQWSTEEEAWVGVGPTDLEIGQGGWCRRWPQHPDAPHHIYGPADESNPDGSRASVGMWGGPNALPDWYLDIDNDTFEMRFDCEPLDGSAYPGASETCDGVDDNCDGEPDLEGGVPPSTAGSWFSDTDNDGIGAGEAYVSCEGDDAHPVDVEGDCDPSRADVYPGAVELCDEVDNDCDGLFDGDDPTSLPTWFQDLDGDGFGDPSTLRRACDPPGLEWVLQGEDCDDSTAARRPGAAELCDGEDDDCDGVIDEPSILGLEWFRDEDSDGWGSRGAGVIQACEAPNGYVRVDGDCHDLDAGIHPLAKESCDGDLRDLNCDGSVGDQDADGDGFRACEDCNDLNAAKYPGAADAPYDGEIFNCDHTSDYDADGDGHDAEEWGGDDCDDTNHIISPSTIEIPGNGIDDNCDGVVSPGEADGDTDGVDRDEKACEGCSMAGGGFGGWPVLGLVAVVRFRRRTGVDALVDPL